MQMVFNWEESIDVDNDELEYHFKLYNGTFSETNLDILIDTLISDITVNVSYDILIELIGMTGDNNINGDWFVYTTDGIDTVMSNEIWHISINASEVLSIDGDILPTQFALHQNYPNPFNPITKIKYDLPEDALVTIKIFDIMGRNVRTLVNTKQAAGYRFARWNATNDFGESISAGMYIYMIQAGEFRSTKKMVLLK